MLLQEGLAKPTQRFDVMVMGPRNLRLGVTEILLAHNFEGFGLGFYTFNPYPKNVYCGGRATGYDLPQRHAKSVRARNLAVVKSGGLSRERRNGKRMKFTVVFRVWSVGLRVRGTQ